MRYPPIKVDDMTPRQREIAADTSNRREGAPSGPHAALIYSPEVAVRVQLLDEYLRFKLHVPERLRVLAVLVAAGRYRSTDLSHFTALGSTKHSGLAQATIAALAAGRRPPAMKDDEEIVYDFCTELAHTGHARSATFERMLGRFGHEVCLEFVEVCGYALFMTTFLNVTQTSLQD